MIETSQWISFSSILRDGNAYNCIQWYVSITSPDTHTNISSAIRLHVLNITVDISPNLFVITNLNNNRLSSPQLQYNFYDSGDVLIGAIALTERTWSLTVFSWTNDGTWFNQTNMAIDFKFEGMMYWFVYDGTLQYGFNSSFFWLQAGLLVTPWIPHVVFVELINASRSNITIASILSLESTLYSVVLCYECAFSPLTVCFPIS
jgi:hypothetical protein